MAEFSFLNFVGDLIVAALWTITMSLIAYVFGAIVGALLLAARLAQLRFAHAGISTYVQVLQGTPLLLQLLIVYFGLGVLGLKASVGVAAVVALTLYTSAYLTEIWRKSVAGIPKDQWEAAQSLAMNLSQQLRHVVIPSAIRSALPPTVGFLVPVIKGTALASVVKYVELTQTGNMIYSVTYPPFVALCCVALMYVALCYPVRVYAESLERKLNAGPC